MSNIELQQFDSRLAFYIDKLDSFMEQWSRIIKPVPVLEEEKLDLLLMPVLEEEKLDLLLSAGLELLSIYDIESFKNGFILFLNSEYCDEIDETFDYKLEVDILKAGVLWSTNTSANTDHDPESNVKLFNNVCNKLTEKFNNYLGWLEEISNKLVDPEGNCFECDDGNLSIDTKPIGAEIMSSWLENKEWKEFLDSCESVNKDEGLVETSSQAIGVHPANQGDIMWGWFVDADADADTSATKFCSKLSLTDADADADAYPYTYT